MLCKQGYVSGRLLGEIAIAQTNIIDIAYDAIWTMLVNTGVGGTDYGFWFMVGYLGGYKGVDRIWIDAFYNPPRLIIPFFHELANKMLFDTDIYIKNI
jgi:hypothetical protein